MRLRARLALTLAALVIPLAALLVWGQDRLEWAARRNVLSGAVLSRMQSGGRERCESDAAHWPGRASPSRETSPPRQRNIGSVTFCRSNRCARIIGAR